MKKLYKLLFLLLLFPVFTYAQINAADTIEKAPATGMAFFAGIGMVSSTVNFTGNDELNGVGSSGNLSPQINAGGDFYFDKSSKTIIFRIALSYNFGSKTAFTTTYIDDAVNESNLSQSTEVLKFSQNTASITPQFLWNFYNSKTIKVYIDAGFGLYANMFSSKNFSVSTHYSTSGTTTTSSRVFPSMHSMVYSAPLQAGVTLSGHFNIYGGYIPRTSLNSETGYSVDEMRYLAGINYILGK